MSSVHINGNAIRALRERRELTQLYLATVVGVTTDTISRWENNKYPSIKLENAEKLAQALEVSLEELLEPPLGEGEGEAPGAPEPAAAAIGSAERRRAVGWQGWRLPLLGAILIVFLAAAAYLWWKSTGQPTISAVRTLPRHSAPGHSFPVLIRLQADSPVNVPIILRERIAARVTASGVGREGGSHDFGDHPRWIGRLVEGEAVFLYLVQPHDSVRVGQEIHFSGDCVSGSIKKRDTVTGGAQSVTIAPYHWADQDQDLQITDSEILDAYERFSSPGKENIDFSEIEQLWLAGGYRWDSELQGFFAVQPQQSQ